MIEHTACKAFEIEVFNNFFRLLCIIVKHFSNGVCFKRFHRIKQFLYRLKQLSTCLHKTEEVACRRPCSRLTGTHKRVYSFEHFRNKTPNLLHALLIGQLKSQAGKDTIDNIGL